MYRNLARECVVAADMMDGDNGDAMAIGKSHTTSASSTMIVLPASMASTLPPAAISDSNRSQADGRHIEPHVLLRLGDFDDGKAALRAQLAGAANAGVGAFDRFNGNHRPAFHGDALADVEPAHLFGQRPAKLNVVLLARPSGRGE